MTTRQLSSASGRALRSGSADAQDRTVYHYPAIPTIRSPPTAHVARVNHFPSTREMGSDRTHGSISTESTSSQGSYQKRKSPSSGSRWPSPTHEQTLVNTDPDPYYSSQSTRRTESFPTRTVYKKPEMIETHSPALAYIRERRQTEEEYDDEDNDEDHALWVLFWLSILDPIHSLASSLFTLIVTCGLVLAFPTRLVHKQSSFGDQTIRTLAPMFKHHLEMMYARSVDYAFEWDFRLSTLIFVHLFAPLISIGVAVASWVTAGFWVFTSIMGNPDGTERRDDGADAVLAVRNWWERCLLKAVRPRVRHSLRSVV